MKDKKKILVILLLLVVGISIGYAAITTTLNINGNTKIEKASWDVHFENLVLSEGIVDATVDASIDSTKTVIDYTINLVEPGDFYEFTVDIVNNGSIDAMISEVLKEGLTTEQEKYIDYSVKYTDGFEVLEKDSLIAGNSRNVTVIVKYKEDIDAEDLPTEEQALNLSFAVTYIQDDGTSTVVCDYDIGSEWDFNYSGQVDEFVVPCNGTYKFEVYGAQGGTVNSGIGGAGGYSVGNKKLVEDTNLYITVGGTSTSITGGYNGGGNGTTAYGGSAYGGGGATHIAIDNNRGELKNYDLYRNEVLIVAGGGGGGAYASQDVVIYKNGGAGGGLNGINGASSGAGSGTDGVGGTQIDGNAFGTGGNGAATFGQAYNSSNGTTHKKYGHAGGGGGGYFGGGGGVANGASSTSGVGARLATGAGGSGYIDGLSNAQTIAGNLEIPTYDGTGTMTGNAGDGYAKITLVSFK